MKAESISMIRATKLSSDMLSTGPAVSANKLHENTRLMVLSQDPGFCLYHADQSLTIGIADRDNQPAANTKLCDQRLRNVRAACCDKNRIVRRVFAPAYCSIEPLHRCVVAAQLPDVPLS